MAIGYACIHIGSEQTKLAAIRLKNATESNLRAVIAKNLDALEAITNYNVENDIRLFRISSDIIPLASHSANTLNWWKEYEERLRSIGNIMIATKMRISMHPGQYTVLNSIHPDIVQKAIKDLEYHCKFLDALGCNQTCKIILHIGGVYADKKASIERFVKNYMGLSNSIKNRLVIENDDKSYNIEDVLLISKRTGIPVVFDNLHHELNHLSSSKLTEYDWINLCNKTWREKDGNQKIHYSQNKPNGTRGAHSIFINSKTFILFYSGLHSKSIDIMLEVKDKNLSAVKCNLLIDSKLKIQSIEKEWARYKYYVLSRSASIYKKIRILLKDKDHPSAECFYHLIEESQSMEETIGAEINAAQHVWGYVNKKATEIEKKRFYSLISEYENKKKSSKSIKNFLYKLATKQSVSYLIKSLYFYIFY